MDEASNNRLKPNGVPTGRLPDGVVHEMLPGKPEAPENTPVAVKLVVVPVSVADALEAFMSPVKETRPASEPCTDISAAAEMLLNGPVILVLAVKVPVSDRLRDAFTVLLGPLMTISSYAKYAFAAPTPNAEPPPPPEVTVLEINKCVDAPSPPGPPADAYSCQDIPFTGPYRNSAV